MSAQIPADSRTMPRLTPAQRIERLVVTIAFIGLALSGLPQRYATEPWARALMILGGGIESMRILHRFFAALLIAEVIYHVLALAYNRFVFSRRWVMLPDIGDFRSLVDRVLGNLGLRQTDGQPASNNFYLRIEYLVLVLAVLVLGITGLMLWNPIATTTILPGEAIPIAHSVHSEHAVLTVVLIVLLRIGIVFLWRPRRAEIFAESGETIAADRIQARRQRFLPVALVLAGVVIVALVLFLTSEQTAINTVPRQQAVIFAPQISPETGDAHVGAALWATLRCAFCHGADGQGGPHGEPSLLRADLTFDAFFEQVRVGRGEMPAFTVEELPDGYLVHLWSWLEQARG